MPKLFAALLIAFQLFAASNAQLPDLGNLTSTVLGYYKTLYNGTNYVNVWVEDWRLIELPFTPDDFVNIGIHYGTTIVSAGGTGLIGGAGSTGSTHHTCYVGNFLPPTCMSQHWAANVAAKFGPGADNDKGFDGWMNFTTGFGNAYIGLVIERFFEVNTAEEEVAGSRVEFDSYRFLTDQGQLEDLASLLWYWSSPGKLTNQHPGGRNLTYLEVQFKPILTVLGSMNKQLKFTFMFTNSFSLLDTSQFQAGQMDTSLTSKSMEVYIEVMNWQYQSGGQSTNKIAVEVNWFTSMVERTTYGSNGINIITTTDASLNGTAKRDALAVVQDGFQTTLPTEGTFSVWQAAGNWIANPNDVTFFTMQHSAQQGSQLEKLTIRQRRYDTTTGKTKQEMKNALYDDYGGSLDDLLKTVWNVGNIYFNKFFDGKELAHTTSVYEFYAIATRVGITTMKWSVGQGVGPYVNPYQTSDTPDLKFPSCSDGIRNQGETNVDCGGPLCDLCETCDNGIKDQGEQAVDCGGPNCAPCVGLQTEEGLGGIPVWVWIIVGVVVLLLIGLLVLLVLFLVLGGNKKKGMKRHHSQREGSLRYAGTGTGAGGTSTTMGEIRRPTSQRTGRSRASSRAGTERTTPSRSHSQANLPSW